MHRALPVGNKVCAARVRQRYEDQRQQRLRDMKGMVDNAAPPTMGMRHLRVNLKKAEITAQRYDNIERDNRHLLNHMNSIGGQREYSSTRSRSMPLLRDPPGGPFRQQVVDRVNRENALILKRLQHIQPEYRTRDWEDQYSRTAEYVRIKCEYPPPMLPRKRVTSRTSLVRLPSFKAEEGQEEVVENPEYLDEEQQASRQASRRSAGSRSANEDAPDQGQPQASGRSEAPGGGGDLGPEPDGGAAAQDLQPEMDQAAAVAEGPRAGTRCVFSGPVEMGQASHHVEMVTDGQLLNICLFDQYAGRTVELQIDEDSHLRLRAEADGDYGLVAGRLRLSGDNLVLE